MALPDVAWYMEYGITLNLDCCNALEEQVGTSADTVQRITYLFSLPQDVHCNTASKTTTLSYFTASPSPRPSIPAEVIFDADINNPCFEPIYVEIGHPDRKVLTGYPLFQTDPVRLCSFQGTMQKLPVYPVWTVALAAMN